MKKIISLLLALLILVGCTGKKTSNEEYLKLLENYKPREKTNNVHNNEEFEKFLDDFFKEEISRDYTSLHFSVTDYKKMGLTKPEVSLGKVEYESKEEVDRYTKILEKLHSFDYAELSYKQQYDYEALEYSIYETLADLEYNKYSLLFGQNVDTMSNIVTILTDFSFYDEESVDDYLILLEDVDRYLDDCLSFTEQQRKNKFYMSDSDINETLLYINRFLKKVDDNEIINSYKDRVENLDFLSEEKKKSTSETVSKITKEKIIPAFEKVKSALLSYKGKQEEGLPLGEIDKNYAKTTIYLQSSASYDIDDIYLTLTDCFRNMFNKYIAALNHNPNIDNDLLELEVNFPLDAKELLAYLYANINEYYPQLENIDYEVNPLDPSAASDNVLAYYWQAPLDDLNHNIIRTNPNNLSDDPIQTYTTLAHEGIPGHMYQHVYYYSTNPSRMRSAISFIGYTEGWAVWAQRLSFELAGFENEDILNAAFFNNAYYFVLYSILDIGINYYGWSQKDAEKEFTKLNVNSDLVSYLYPFIKDMAGVYLSYGAGYAYIEKFASKAKAALGTKFDYASFHDAILKNGPLPFAILEGAVDEYITNNK